MAGVHLHLASDLYSDLWYVARSPIADAVYFSGDVPYSTMDSELRLSSVTQQILILFAPGMEMYPCRQRPLHPCRDPLPPLPPDQVEERVRARPPPSLEAAAASPPTGPGGGEGAAATAASTPAGFGGGEGATATAAVAGVCCLPPNLVEGRVRAPPLSSPEAAAASHPVRPGEGDGAVTATRPPPHVAERSERGERKREKDKADARSARRLGSVLDRCRLF